MSSTHFLSLGNILQVHLNAQLLPFSITHFCRHKKVLKNRQLFHLAILTATLTHFCYTKNLCCWLIMFLNNWNCVSCYLVFVEGLLKWKAKTETFQSQSKNLRWYIICEGGREGPKPDWNGNKWINLWRFNLSSASGHLIEDGKDEEKKWWWKREERQHWSISLRANYKLTGHSSICQVDDMAAAHVVVIQLSLVLKKKPMLIR